MINDKVTGVDARMIEMSGIGTYIQHLMGHGLYDYALGSEAVIRKYDRNVRVIPYDAPIYSPGEQLLFPNGAVKIANISLLHFPHYNVPFSYRGRYVVTVHDLTHIVLPETLGSRAKYHYAKFLMHQALGRAEHIFTDSENSRSDIRKYFNTDETKISIAYAAADEDFRRKEKAETVYLCKKYGIPGDKKKILYVGNLKPHKNLVTLLRAVKRLGREDLILILVGKSFRSENLEEQERKLKIDRQVIHTGTVSKEELIDLYNLADLFVFPSLYEGFGIPPLEAMACGTPVIAADNSSIPEVVGNAAVLFDGKNPNELARQISRTLKDEALRAELIQKGFIRSRQFDWKQTRSGILEVLDGLTR